MKRKTNRKTESKGIGRRWGARIPAILLAFILAAASPAASLTSYAQEPAASQSQQSNADAQEGQDDTLISESGVDGQDGGGQTDSQQTQMESGAQQAQPGGSGEGQSDSGAQDTVKPGDSGKDKSDKKDEAKEEDEEDEDENPWKDLKSVTELGMLPDTVAEATIEYLGKDAPAVNARGWKANIYYTNQKDAHDVVMDSDFSLKYQLVFEASEDYAPKTVTFRVPLSLVKTEDGKEIEPSKIGVPHFVNNTAAESHKTFFNYEIDTEKGELVFFNYTKIPKNTVSAWQVLYENVDVSKVKNGAHWSFLPDVTVQKGSEKQHLDEGELLPLKGTVSYEEEKDSQEEKKEEDEKEEDGQESEEAQPDADAGQEIDSVQELEDIDEDTAGALKSRQSKEAAKAESALMKLMDAGSSHSDFWTYDLYYINTPDSHHIEATNDFKVKYQMEFTNSTDLDAGDVEIRLPKEMILYGHGSEERQVVSPSDLGLPKGTPANPVPARRSSSTSMRTAMTMSSSTTKTFRQARRTPGRYCTKALTSWRSRTITAGLSCRP